MCELECVNSNIIGELWSKEELFLIRMDYNELLILCRPSVINFLICDLFSICVSIYNIRNLEFFLNFENFSVINCGIRNLKI